MDLVFFLMISTMVLFMEQEGHTASLSVSGPVAGRGMPLQFGNRVHQREKRCSCENLKDKECVYFCHIGIVWVNTPSQIIPYGVGSLQLRLKRDVVRCFCRNKRDTECLKFCYLWNFQGENPSDLVYPPGKSRERHKLSLKQRGNSPTQKT